MNELIESIVDSFINGNFTDCKEHIREYAKTEESATVLINYVFDNIEFDRNKETLKVSFANTIYRALLNN